MYLAKVRLLFSTLRSFKNVLINTCFFLEVNVCLFGWVAGNSRSGDLCYQPKETSWLERPTRDSPQRPLPSKPSLAALPWQRTYGNLQLWRPTIGDLPMAIRFWRPSAALLVDPPGDPPRPPTPPNLHTLPPSLFSVPGPAPPPLSNGCPRRATWSRGDM